MGNFTVPRRERVPKALNLLLRWRSHLGTRHEPHAEGEVETAGLTSFSRIILLALLLRSTVM